MERAGDLRDGETAVRVGNREGEEMRVAAGHETDLRGDAGEGEPAARRRRWGSGEPSAGIGGSEE